MLLRTWGLLSRITRGGDGEDWSLCLGLSTSAWSDAFPLCLLFIDRNKAPQTMIFYILRRGRRSEDWCIPPKRLLYRKIETIYFLLVKGTLLQQLKRYLLPVPRVQYNLKLLCLKKKNKLTYFIFSGSTFLVGWLLDYDPIMHRIWMEEKSNVSRPWDI